MSYPRSIMPPSQQRINELLETLKQEFETVTNEASLYRMHKDEFDHKCELPNYSSSLLSFLSFLYFFSPFFFFWSFTFFQLLSLSLLLYIFFSLLVCFFLVLSFALLILSVFCSPTSTADPTPFPWPCPPFTIFTLSHYSGSAYSIIYSTSSRLIFSFLFALRHSLSTPPFVLASLSTQSSSSCFASPPHCLPSIRSIQSFTFYIHKSTFSCHPQS